MSSKVCKICLIDKPLNNFYLRQRATGLFYRNECMSCNNNRRSKLALDNHNSKRRRDRREFKNIEAYICKDCKYKDKQAGFTGFDLTKETIKELIKNGCTYCGEGSTKIRMTLDRIDNNSGHTRNNVIAACYRCNIIRGTMPFDVWLEVVPTMRSIRERGLFGNWMGKKLM